jgi:hypothetical protein
MFEGSIVPTKAIATSGVMAIPPNSPIRRGLKVMAKSEQVNTYLDASPEDFSETVQGLLRQERAAYEVLKAAKAAVLVAIRAECPVGEGLEIKYTAYTRWGQWQIVVGETAQPKAAKPRATLADYLAERGSQGRAS